MQNDQHKQEQAALDQENPQETEEQQQQDGEGQLEQRLEEEQRKSEEYLDLLRRTQADFINYKRRVSQEQEEVRTTAQIALLQQILPVLDDLGRAMSVAPAEMRNQPWVQGMALVAKRLYTTLDQLGVRQIGKAGEHFDPRWHEAVTMQENPDMPEGTILEVTRPGYAIGERVIRPAQVVVVGTASPTRAS